MDKMKLFTYRQELFREVDELLMQCLRALPVDSVSGSVSMSERELCEFLRDMMDKLEILKCQIHHRIIAVDVRMVEDIISIRENDPAILLVSRSGGKKRTISTNGSDPIATFEMHIEHLLNLSKTGLWGLKNINDAFSNAVLKYEEKERALEAWREERRRRKR